MKLYKFLILALTGLSLETASAAPVFCPKFGDEFSFRVETRARKISENGGSRSPVVTVTVQGSRVYAIYIEQKRKEMDLPPRPRPNVTTGLEGFANALALRIGKAVLWVVDTATLGSLIGSDSDFEKMRLHYAANAAMYEAIVAYYRNQGQNVPHEVERTSDWQQASGNSKSNALKSIKCDLGQPREE